MSKIYTSADQLIGKTPLLTHHEENRRAKCGGDDRSDDENEQKGCQNHRMVLSLGTPPNTN